MMSAKGRSSSQAGEDVFELKSDNVASHVDKDMNENDTSAGGASIILDRTLGAVTESIVPNDGGNFVVGAVESSQYEDGNTGSSRYNHESGPSDVSQLAEIMLRSDELLKEKLKLFLEHVELGRASRPLEEAMRNIFYEERGNMAVDSRGEGHSGQSKRECKRNDLGEERTPGFIRGQDEDNDNISGGVGSRTVDTVDNDSR
jgi:hypothetical protein